MAVNVLRLGVIVIKRRYVVHDLMSWKGATKPNHGNSS